MHFIINGIHLNPIDSWIILFIEHAAGWLGLGFAIWVYFRPRIQRHIHIISTSRDLDKVKEKQELLDDELYNKTKEDMCLTEGDSGWMPRPARPKRSKRNRFSVFSRLKEHSLKKNFEDMNVDELVNVKKELEKQEIQYRSELIKII
jgi:hypothetical protein